MLKHAGSKQRLLGQQRGGGQTEEGRTVPLCEPERPLGLCRPPKIIPQNAVLCAHPSSQLTVTGCTISSQQGKANILSQPR